MSLSTNHLFDVFYERSSSNRKDHTNRNNIIPGRNVLIVKKEDQRTGKLVHGTVKHLLTRKSRHTRGIKVRLPDGTVGRVQKIV